MLMWEQKAEKSSSLAANKPGSGEKKKQGCCDTPGWWTGKCRHLLVTFHSLPGLYEPKRCKHTRSHVLSRGHDVTRLLCESSWIMGGTDSATPPPPAAVIPMVIKDKHAGYKEPLFPRQQTETVETGVGGTSVKCGDSRQNEGRREGWMLLVLFLWFWWVLFRTLLLGMRLLVPGERNKGQVGGGKGATSLLSDIALLLLL